MSLRHAPHRDSCACGRCSSTLRVLDRDGQRRKLERVASGAIRLDPLQRRAVLGGRKTAHLMLASDGELPARPGQIRPIHRTLLDLNARDPQTGHYINRRDDGTPKPDPTPLHVHIDAVDAMPLGDVVKADAIAHGFAAIHQLARWWMDTHSPQWRDGRDDGDLISAEDTLAEWRDRWHSRTAWMVRWTLVDERDRYLAGKVGGYVEGSDPLAAGAVLLTPEEQAELSDSVARAEMRARQQEAEDRAAQARDLVRQMRQLLDGAERAPGAERRRLRNQHRRMLHDLERQAEHLKHTAGA